MSYDAKFIVTALCIRILLALSTSGFFQPDEYFQSLEVAHHLVFGYGRLTWEWLAPNPIRSIFYPALNVPIYWSLKVLGWDDTRMLIWGPKVLHGILAAGTDIWLCKLTRRILGDRYDSTAFFLSVTSLFHGLSLSRSMSNSFETTLTTIALSFVPWGVFPANWRSELRKSFLFAALACAVRPTNVIIWVYVVFMLTWRLRTERERLISMLMDLFTIGAGAILILVALDSLYYHKLTLTPLNFVLTNLSSTSLFYGSSPWHYYLSQALPILGTTSLPFMLHGAWLATKQSSKATKSMLGLIVWTIAIFSAAGHKEWRFIHPLLPLFHVLAAKSLVDLNSGPHDKTEESNSDRKLPLSIRKSHLALILLNIPPILYLALFHSRAPIDVIHYLKTLPADEVHSVGFLMPCHSTPWQAYLHRPDWAEDGKLWALGCEPPLAGEDILSYKDQTGVFYESPTAYLQTYFPSTVDPTFPPSPSPMSKPGAATPARDWQHEWPEYIIMFDALLTERTLREMLQRLHYREVWYENFGWEEDERRRGGVRVWRYKPVL